MTDMVVVMELNPSETEFLKQITCFTQT